MATNTRDFSAKYGVSAPVIKSTISTGTAPLQVASTTKVTNLNADLLDGLEASAFLSNPMTTIGDVIYGGAAGAPTRLAGQATNGIYFLSESVVASTAVAPAWLGSTGTTSVVLSGSPTITTPVIDSIAASGTAAAATVHSTVTTGSIAIGAGLTTGTLNLAAAGTGATVINIGHTNADINLTAATIDVTGTLAATSPAFTTSITTPSTTVAIVDTTATTVNFARAATALVMGAASGTTTVQNNLTVSGNLTVNGTTTTLNSTTVTIDDPIFVLGGDTAPVSDDNLDRGIEFRWFSGTAKLGFFGFDDSTGYMTFIPDATDTAGVISGTLGDIQAANFRGALIGNADTATSATSAGKATNLVGGNNTTLLGSMPYQSNTDVTTMLAPNTTTTKMFLNQTGTGTNGAAPTWAALVNADIPTALTGKSYNGLTLTSTTGTFTLAAGKTFAVNNTVTINGTDSTTITLPSTTGTVALNNQTFFLGTTSIAINRTTAAQALTGITSIDGSAASLAMTNADITSDTATITANATPTTLDSFAVATYRSAKYLVQSVQGTKVSTTEFLVMWDGTDVNISEYGYVDATAGAANVTLNATHSAGTITVTGTSSDAATTNVIMKSAVTYIKT